MDFIERVGAVIAIVIAFTTPYTRKVEVNAVVTAYTCEAITENPMYPCNTTRWGRNPSDPNGAACPVEWRGRKIIVAGTPYICDDTGRYDTWNGLPHIDIRLDTLRAARDWGAPTILIGVCKC